MAYKLSLKRIQISLLASPAFQTLLDCQGVACSNHREAVVGQET